MIGATVKSVKSVDRFVRALVRPSLPRPDAATTGARPIRDAMGVGCGTVGASGTVSFDSTVPVDELIGRVIADGYKSARKG